MTSIDNQDGTFDLGLGYETPGWFAWNTASFIAYHIPGIKLILSHPEESPASARRAVVAPSLPGVAINT